jgi:hypothetical protein
MGVSEWMELAFKAGGLLIGVIKFGRWVIGRARRWRARRAEWRRLEPERRAAAWRSERLRESRAAAVVGGRLITF